mgnify:CR=1 FL=1
MNKLLTTKGQLTSDRIAAAARNKLVEDGFDALVMRELEEALQGKSIANPKQAPEDSDEAEKLKAQIAELDEAIELAKDYKTDVYVDGRVVWSYKEYASSVKEMVPIENANDL